MYIYLLLLLLLSLSLSLTLGEDDDDSIDFDDHPSTQLCLSRSLSLCFVFNRVFFRPRKSHNKTQRNTYAHTLSLTIYYRLIVIDDDDANVSISSTTSLFCACKFVVNVDKTTDRKWSRALSTRSTQHITKLIKQRNTRTYRRRLYVVVVVSGFRSSDEVFRHRHAPAKHHVR